MQNSQTTSFPWRVLFLLALMKRSEAFHPKHHSSSATQYSSPCTALAPPTQAIPSNLDEVDSIQSLRSFGVTPRKSLLRRLWMRTQTWRHVAVPHHGNEQPTPQNDHSVEDSRPIRPTGVAAAAMPFISIMDGKTLKVLWNTISQPIITCWHHIQTMTPPQQSLLVAAVAVGFVLGRIKPFWQRYRSANEIPAAYFVGTTTTTGGPCLVGRAIKVTDGDTIRFLHRPTPWHPTALAKGQKLSEYAIPIRICTMDTPETAKFGKQGQPFGEEAKHALEDFLKNRKVYVRLLQKDQYARAVAQVYVKNFWGRPQYADEYMLRQGLAEVYRGGGAVYGPKGLEAYSAMEAEAQRQKVGIWSMKKRESAAEYKKRTKD